MEPRRRGRPPKTDDIVESVKPINQGRNAVIKLVLSMPGHSDYEDTIVIRDIMGKTTGSQRNPKTFMAYIKDKIE